MPLMQLSTLVLPAPYGPISASSSAGSTASDTPSSTVSPPKLKRSSSISSSAIPSPIASVLLHLPVAAARSLLRLAEVELLYVRMVAEAGGIAVENDAAVLQHVAVVDHPQRNGSGLLDD